MFRTSTFAERGTATGQKRWRFWSATNPVRVMGRPVMVPRAVTVRCIAQPELRAAYAVTPRLEEPFAELDGVTKVEHLPEETASDRRTAFWELRLLSPKSHFFSRTYCFPRRASSPDSTIWAINRL